MNMITWEDGSQPVMRRPVRGHKVVFHGVSVDPSLPGPRAESSYIVSAHCPICGTSWAHRVSWGTGRRLLGPDSRKTVALVMAEAVSRTPACEDAYRAMVARDVIES